MTTYEIKEVNCTTGEETVRDMTADEIAVCKADEAQHKNKRAAETAAVAAKAALLERLGITADEAAILLS